MSDTDTSVDVEARGAIEAIVLAATEPVPPTVLAQLLELPVEAIDELCAELAAEYEREGRGFQLARVAGGYRFQTHPDAYAYVERFVLDGQTARLSGPALETLAIIAYKQPIARAQLSAIRGVNVDATLKTLVARGYVDEIGHEPTPGNPSLFSTTPAVPRTARASTRSPISRRSPTSCPSRRSSRRSSGACAASTSSSTARRRRPPSRAGARARRAPTSSSVRRTTASGCRRCSRARASARGARARC